MKNLRAVCFILFDFVFILKCHITYITCLLWRLYQNINPSVTRKPWRIMSTDAKGDVDRCQRWHNAPGLLCHWGADILVCHPRSHVIYVECQLWVDTYPPLLKQGECSSPCLTLSWRYMYLQYFRNGIKSNCTMKNVIYPVLEYFAYEHFFESTENKIL